MTAFDVLYLPAVAYLVVVSALVLGTHRCPTWVHPAALGMGVPLRLIQQPSWADAVLPLTVAFGVFVIAVFVAARLLSGVTLFTLVTTLALLPFDGWLAVLIGLGAAAVVSIWRTYRNLGKDRITILTLDTMSAMGVAPNGAITRPDSSRLLRSEDAVDVQADTVESKRMRLHLPPYLLLGVAAGMLISGAAG